MTDETLAILRSPHHHEPLRPELLDDGREVLLGAPSGEPFPVEDGIPVLLDPARIGALDRRYQRFYDRVAQGYDAAMALAGRAAGGQGKVRQAWLDLLELRAGEHLLEVSVGTGANLLLLPPQVRCTGLDISMGMLRRCRRQLRAHQREAFLVQGDAHALPFVDHAFDAVLHVGGINAFSDRRQALAEMARVVRPGGWVVVADETARLVERLSWFPGARRMLREYADRFEPPVEELPAGMEQVEVRSLAHGALYCLRFRTPLAAAKVA